MFCVTRGAKKYSWGAPTVRIYTSRLAIAKTLRATSFRADHHFSTFFFLVLLRPLISFLLLVHSKQQIRTSITSMYPSDDPNLVEHSHHGEEPILVKHRLNLVETTKFSRPVNYPYRFVVASSTRV